MLNYLVANGYSEEEIQLILEEIEYHRQSNEEWVAADPYAYEGEVEFEDVPF